VAATGAMLKWFVLETSRLRSTGFIKNPFTAAAFQETLSPLDRNERDEE